MTEVEFGGCTNVGKTFVKVREHAGVYKRNKDGMDAFDRFINKEVIFL